MKNHALGLVALSAAAAFGLAACGGSSSPASGGSGPTTASGSSGSASSTPPTSKPSSAENLKTGDCFNSGLTAGNSGNVTDITRIDCGQPHQYEVIGTALAAGAYPGDSSLNDQTTTFCKGQFKSYVGIDYSQSSYGLQPVYPTQDSWGKGDRVEQCWVHGQNGATLTGSVKGTAK